VFTTVNNCYIVTEFRSGGDLFRVVKTKKDSSKPKLTP
jgi:hypothetical protein